ncbi:MAG: DUF1491 family protein [Pseudomonadota bacterium]|nr:DUF1491 family protein [Pseudomonadota bacterium]
MDRPPRIKTEIRVAAHLRRIAAAGAFAQVVRKGDPDAGAVAVKVFVGRGEEGPLARLFVQSRNEAGDLIWRDAFDGPTAEGRVDERLARDRRVDPDLWIVEIEDRQGRSFLDD